MTQSLLKYFMSTMLLLLLAYPNLGQAQEETTTMPLISAVQRRPSQLTQELSMHFSYMPLDHFQTYFSVGLSYFYYFSDYLAWEVVNANYVQNSPTGLESYLNGTYNANPETFDIIQMYATSNIVYTPLYMKHLSRGKNIGWGDLSLVAGAGSACRRQTRAR